MTTAWDGRSTAASRPVTGVGAAIAGYLAGAVVPVLAAAALITTWVQGACDDTQEECWAPLAYILLIPAALVALALLAPIGAVVALRARGHAHAGATGWRCFALGLLYPAVGAVMAIGAEVLPVVGVVLSLGQVGLVVVVPALARVWAVRSADEAVGDRVVGETTWESPWPTAGDLPPGPPARGGWGPAPASPPISGGPPGPLPPPPGGSPPPGPPMSPAPPPGAASGQPAPGWSEEPGWP